MSVLFEMRARVLEHEAKQALIEKEIELERLRQKPAREWVGLTDDDIWDVYTKTDSMQYMEFSRAIEAKLKELNS